MVLPNTNDPFADQHPYGWPEMQEGPKKNPHRAIYLLAVIVGSGMIAANLLLLGTEGSGPRFRVGGLVLGPDFCLRGSPVAPESLEMNRFPRHSTTDWPIQMAV